MKGVTPINRDERLYYLDLFHQVRDLSIDSPFHYLLFDEDQSPVLQALTLDQILSLHPTDAPINQRVWCCGDVADLVRHKRELWLRQPGRLALCLQRKADATGALAVLHAWIATALELGASVQDPPRQESFGAEAWLLDPEGNRLLLLVLPAS